MEVNIIQDPPTPSSSLKSALKSHSLNDPEGSVASLNLMDQSTIRKMDNIIEEINVQENNNNDTSEKEETMSVMTGSGGMNWEYHLDLDHILQLNEIPPTYKLCLHKKIKKLIKVKSNIDYVRNYANNLIEQNYCVHILIEESTNTSSLLSIPESATASKESASATIN